MKNILLIALLSTSFVLTAQRNPFQNLSERNGKIGIGTDKPDELLTVKGKIHTQEVLVDLKGAVAPDFVFEAYFKGISALNPDYKMPTLAEVAKFLEENHHLPSIPSAATLKEEGLALKEMNLLLLQKIEELTLYTIEQQKQIDALKEVVSKLQE
tara:strand:- start:209 stop:673 length:465 start_codon:yes stop_codon:yes gene_type:complete